MTIGVLPQPRDAEAVHETTPEPPLADRVATAVNLGWMIDKLKRATERREADNDLEGLTFAGVIQVHHWEITAAVDELGPRLRRDHLAVALRELAGTVEHLHQCGQFPGRERCHELGSAIKGLHRALTGALAALHYKIGKAYRLGHRLAELYRMDQQRPAALSGNFSSVASRFSEDKLNDVLTILADLHCVLPAKVAGMVSLSLQMTADYVRLLDRDLSEDELRALSLQGHRWRAMLTGSSNITDILETADYVSAGRVLIRNYVDLLKQTVHEFRLPLAIIGLLGAGGIVVSFVTISNGWQVPSAVLSALVAFLSSMRLIAPSMVRVVEKAGPKLWAEAVIAVVARALTQAAPSAGVGPLRLESSRLPSPHRAWR